MQNVGPVQSGYTYQTIISGVSPTAPSDNNQTTAMPTAHGTFQSQQDDGQGYPLFAGHQTIHTYRNGGNSCMPVPNHAGSSTPTQGNAQLYETVQHPHPQFQSTFTEQQILNTKAEFLLTILAGNPNAMNGLVQFCSALTKQSGGQPTQHQNFSQNHNYPETDRIPQSQQLARHYEAAETYQNAGTRQASTESTSSQNTQTVHPGHHVSVLPSPADSSPEEAGRPSQAGATNTDQPSLATAITEEFQQRVDSLVEEPATTFKGYIQSDADFALYEMAAWNAKRKDADVQNKSQGYPTDPLGKSQVKELIFYAIQNMDGEQDPASDRGEFKDCVAVRTVQGLSDLETEILAHKLMEDMRKVQCGEPVIHLPAESKVVQEPSFTDKVDQVVEALSFNKPLCRSATTTAEWIARIAADPAGERHKKNQNNRNNKQKGNALRKDAAARGKSRGKGQKRSAPEALEEDTACEAASEVSDATHPEAVQHNHAQQGKAGTPFRIPDILQPNYMELLNAKKGSEQSQRTPSPNHGDISPSSQSSNPTTDAVDITQTASTSYATPQVATTQASAPGSQSSESGMPQYGHTESPNINSEGDMGLDGQPTTYGEDSAINFGIEDEADISARHEHALNGNDELFSEEENWFNLQPLAEFNAQN